METEAAADLLFAQPALRIDRDVLDDVLDLASYGKDVTRQLEALLLASVPDAGTSAFASISRWEPAFFADDLFLDDLLREGFAPPSDPHGFRHAFVRRVIVATPHDPATIALRQGILRELDDDRVARQAGADRGSDQPAREALWDRLIALHRGLASLVTLFSAPGQSARLDIDNFRLDILRQIRRSIDQLATDFDGAHSGLARLGALGKQLQTSEVYRLLTDVLNHENRFATVHVAVQFGARGQISALHIQSIDGHKDNRFYRPPLRRLWDRLRLAFAHGHTLRARSLVGRIIRDVFVRTTPLVAPLLQLLGHLEVYLGARAFRRRAEARGRAVTLPTIAVDDDAPLQLDQLWNPLLLPAAQAPVPCTLSSDDGHSLTLITGPNSGGKTRLLQAIGLAQLLGQSGLYVAASTAQLRRVHGLFISLVARETADQAEGRLGRELTRIRALLEAVDPPALVILDELCSGTNPSEGIEVFGLVLRILERLTPRAFITTHFLDYARQLEAQRPIDALRFLQVEVDAGQRPTYRFVPGVAATSMAAVMAERLGMTFERLDALARARQDEVSGP